MVRPIQIPLINLKKIHLLIFFPIFFGFFSCENNIETVRMVTEKNNLPIETGKTVQMNYTDSGYLKARIFTPLMERYANDEKNYTEMRKGLTAYFFNRKRKVESYLRSKYAIRYDRDRKMIARIDVVLVNYKGDTLNTEELNWDENTQRIFSDKAVRITTPDEIIFGEGFESSTEFDRYKILKVKGTISIKK